MIPNTPEHQPEQQADGAETPQARWDYVFELLDEILGDWSLPPLPVILDARGLPELGVLVAGLEARSLGYFIQVSPGTTLPATGGDPMTGAGQVGAPRPDPATPTGRPRPGRRRRLLSPQGARSPRSLWLTNLDARGQADVAKMTRQRWRPRQTLQELQELHGLQHFEGRSLRGWHHHVTLVSLAHFFEILISFQNF